MRIESLALELRPRPMYEAADLGVRLAQCQVPALWRCYAPLALCVFALSVAAIPLGGWVSILMVFLAKPWLDRTLMFVYARAAFGVQCRWNDLWQARRAVWFGQCLRTFSARRLSPRRAYTQAVYQLEGLEGAARAQRLALMRAGSRGSATLLTSAFSLTESALTLATLSLALWFAPPEHRATLWEWMTSENSTLWTLITHSVYPVIALSLEPFYLAAGFGMYLNRRVELEAWDIEQELRRVFR